jgi:SnoaL-like domain
MSKTEDLEARLRRLEDESSIQRLVMSYGPAADAGRSGFAADLWLEDGEYDWDANGSPYQGSDAVDSMLQSDAHRQLISEGVAHFGGPLLVEVDGDRAAAVNYSLIMRRHEQRFYLWRVSAVRWDLERSRSTWRVRKRTNRLLDESGAGHELFGAALQELFPGGPR